MKYYINTTFNLYSTDSHLFQCLTAFFRLVEARQVDGFLQVTLSTVCDQRGFSLNGIYENVRQYAKMTYRDFDFILFDSVETRVSAFKTLLKQLRPDLTSVGLDNFEAFCQQLEEADGYIEPGLFRLLLGWCGVKVRKMFGSITPIIDPDSSEAPPTSAELSQQWFSISDRTDFSQDSELLANTGTSIDEWLWADLPNTIAVSVYDDFTQVTDLIPDDAVRKAVLKDIVERLQQDIGS